MNLSIILLLLVGAFSTPLQIEYVTISDVQPTSSMEGSLEGGTIIYINGLGFDSVATNNRVFVGEYPCIVSAQGATTNFLSCETSDPISDVNIQNLQILVMANDQIAFAPSSFSYKLGKTPIIYDVFPSTSLPGDRLHIYAQHRVEDIGEGFRNFGQFRGIYVGESQCGLFDIVQDTISANSINRVQCKSDVTQEAGKYNIKEQVSVGYSKSDYKMQKTSATNQYYEHTVLASISSVTPNTIFAGGSPLTITGAGFSTTLTDNSVSVDGINCEVTSATANQIQCNLAPKVSQSAKLATGSGSQVNGYIGGSGFYYARYSTSSLSSRTSAGFKAALDTSSPLLTLVDAGIRAQLETKDIYGTYYGQVFKGYFYAEHSGTYTFSGSGDDSFDLYMSDDYGTATINPTPLISTDHATYDPDNYFIANYSSLIANKSLVGGNYYYMEFYRVNENGPGFGKVSVATPNPSQGTTWRAHEVNQLDMAFTNQAQIRTFTLDNAIGGTFNLSLIRANIQTGQVSYSNEVQIAYDASETDFLNALRQFDIYSPYTLTGSVTTVNNSRIWTVEINELRTDDHNATVLNYQLNDILSNDTLDFTQLQTRPHCPLINGTFTLTIGGENVRMYDASTGSYSNSDIPSNVHASTLQTAIRLLPGMSKAEVYLRGDPAYGATWIISYIGFNDDVDDLVVSAAGLTGGKDGTFPTMTFFQTRKYSQRLLYNPIDENFMFTANSTPNVLVTVNGLLSACVGDCQMTFQSSVPEIQTQTIVSGNKLQLSISDPQSQNYALGELMILLDGQPCQPITGTFASLQCDLPTNTDGTPTIRAGNHNAKVFVQSHGQVLPSASTTVISNPFAITSLMPGTGSANGGYEVVIKGTGFPLAVAEVQSITVCGQSATITSINNIETTIIMPECAVGTETIEYNYDGQTQSTTFSYTSPTSPAQIVSIYPISASPVLKAVMTITGSGFGTNVSAVEIHLSNSSGKIYEMRLLSITDTQIECGIPGGLPGKFDVQVKIDGIGHIPPSPAEANDFTYQVTIDSITPANGSYHGGTLLTITGKNFVDNTQQSLMHVGNELNWLCAIESITTSQIKCRTPTYHSDWTSSTQNLVLNSRLIIDSTCTSSCSFTYDDQAQAMELTTLSSDSGKSSNARSIFGTNLDMSGSSALIVIFQNQLTRVKTEVTPTTVTTTQVDFNVPDVQDGTYWIRTRVDPQGQSNSLSFKVNSQFDSGYMEFSTEGGNLPIAGKGLPSSWPSPLFSISIQSNSIFLDVEVVSTTPSQLTLRLPRGIDGQNYNIVLYTPNKISNLIIVEQKTSATPQLALITSMPIASGLQTIIMNRTSVSTDVNPTSISLHNTLDSTTVAMNVTHTESGTQLSFTETLKAGQYGILVEYASLGNGLITDTLQVIAGSTYSATTTVTSYLGGILTVSGADISPQAVIKVGGMTGKVVSVRTSEADFSIPPLITEEVLSVYPELQTEEKITPQSIISDGGTNPPYISDTQYGTYYQSVNADCFIGVDVGEGKKVKMKRIRFFPYNKWIITSQFLKGAVIEASNDNTNWDQIHVIDQTVHVGWNSHIPTTTTPYRYIRIKHTSTSGCKLAELQIHGVMFSDDTVSDITNHPIPNVMFDDGFNTFTFANVLSYRQDQTPIINTVTNPTGDVYGGYNITLAGSYLDIGAPSIMIDGVACNVQTNTASEIKCQVGSRSALPTQNTFTVTVGGKNALVKKQFMYVLRWSDIRTWGTDLPPVDGDLVYVPKGMTLYVDQSTPRLEGIVVEEGKLIFADESDMDVHAGIITINKGQFRAGTETEPYQHRLTFTMYGDYYGNQLPITGNKGIACVDCKFSMYGEERLKTWSMLSSTINVGDNTFTVGDTVDWRVGETIVVASTSYDHNEAEMKQIVSVSGNTFTVNTPFMYKHLSSTETFGSVNLQMKAEVALLSRNIKMMGDSTSLTTEYGSHLMMVGSAEDGMVSHIAYTEFTHCGQPRIVGRYCMHFHMNGDVPDSYVKGNSVHESFARILTLHGVHYLRVLENVGYRVKGHNFFIEDGIETQNLLENNLAISSLQTFLMMQTDISVASYWVTNPTNHVRNNHAAGGDFYGFWYEIKNRPDGPSATCDICPRGNPLGESHHNVAHSYERFGLRIFVLVAREKPCEDISVDEDNPSNSINPSINSVFNDYVIYKVRDAGVLAEETGDTTFKNFVIADSMHSGMEFFTVFKTLTEVKAENVTIIGQTATNPPPSGETNSAVGVIGPRLAGDLWKLKNVDFYNFVSPTQAIIQSCSMCDDQLFFTNSAQEYMFEAITYTNVTSKKLQMLGLRREIIYDVDGTYSQGFDSNSRVSATIVNNFKHIADEPDCYSPGDQSIWEDTLICDPTITVRKLTFSNTQNQSLFKNTPMKIQLIESVNDSVATDSTSFSEIYSILNNKEPMVSMEESYTAPFVEGRVYNIWWFTGIDFNGVVINAASLVDTSAPAIILKFNYTLNRELYEIADLVDNTLSPLKSVDIQALDASTCEIASYTHSNDEAERNMTLCMSARGKAKIQHSVNVVAIYCRHVCPEPADEFVKEDFVRLYSNVSQWPQERLPMAGENVTIHGNWTMLLDINPEPLQQLVINGDLILDAQRNKNVNITAESIWIRAGSLQTGETTDPFNGTVTIQLNGNKEDIGFVFDRTFTGEPVQGSKQLIVNGKLHLYGEMPSTVWTRLIAFAHRGDTTIQVVEANGWEIGDEIVIGPSFMSSQQQEKVTITAVSSNSITFTPALQYDHYGAAGLTISNEYGELDTRSAVGHISRKIKIVAGPDSGWGFRLLSYSYLDVDRFRKGNVILSGVEFYEGGQYDTESTAVQIKDVAGDHSIITGSTFHDCKSFCLDIDNSLNITVTNNVFYNARVFHVRALDISHFSFTQNLMIAATTRPTLTSGKELIACFGSWKEVDKTLDVVSVTDNVCQGSSGHGFALAYVPCSKIDDNPFAGNTASSTPVGFIFTQVSGECHAASGVKAFATKIGQISSSAGTKELKFKHFLIADSERAVTLRFGIHGRKQLDNTAYLEHSFISAISRPTCTQCYGSNINSCSFGHGVRMLAVTINGEALPDKFGTGYDVICKEEQSDAKAFITNVTFENFNHQYPDLPQCSNNTVFRPHSLAHDLTGSHILSQTRCNNCSSTAFATFTQADQSQLGWEGGCGSILCTGFNNYLIHDTDGSFLGSPGVLIANNSVIGDNTPDCTSVPEINGHHCNRTDFGVLQYQSVAPDYNSRIMWPIYLSYDGGAYVTETNGWREWAWENFQPLNQRLGRFISIIELSKIYNMTFSSEPPHDMLVHFQRRTLTGDNSEFILIKLHYPRPNSIRVEVNGVVIKPITLLDQFSEEYMSNTTCGSNKFFYDNNTIHFIVTGASDCIVRVQMTNSIQLTARFNMDIDEFYNIGGETLFIDRVCAMLNIVDTSRLKIVGIYNGSVTLVAFIEQEVALLGSSESANYHDGANYIRALNQELLDLYSQGTFQQNLTDVGFGSLTSLQTNVYFIPIYEEDSSSNSKTSIPMIIGLSVGGAAFLILIIIGVLYIMKKRSEVKNLEEEPTTKYDTQNIIPITTSENISFSQ